MSNKTQTFIAKARAVHGDRYDYSKASYTMARNKLTIICKEHGEFKQSPNHHFRGQGCPKCAGKTDRPARRCVVEVKPYMPAAAREMLYGVLHA